MVYMMYIVKRTQIYLEEDQAIRLDEHATVNETTRSGVIRAAIDAYFARPADSEARLVGFRAALDAAFGVAPDLPEGEQYVSELRAAAGARESELERRWRG